MLQAILTFITKPKNLNNAAMKTRSGGKAGYTTPVPNSFINSFDSFLIFET